MDESISRQAAIDVVRHSPVIEVQPAYMLIDKADVLKNLIMVPSAQPEIVQKKGTWKHLGGGEWCCNQCGNVIHTEGHWEHPLSNDRKMYHCNICGARMGEKNDAAEVTTVNNDIKAKKALKCVSYVIKYMNDEESWACNSEFVDTKGYAMSCDLGYFYQGLTNLRDMLIKRLRGAVPKYPEL